MSPRQVHNATSEDGSKPLSDVHIEKPYLGGHLRPDGEAMQATSDRCERHRDPHFLINAGKSKIIDRLLLLGSPPLNGGHRNMHEPILDIVFESIFMLHALLPPVWAGVVMREESS